MKNKTHDYLKYWKVVRHYMRVKHKLNQAEIDLMLFLYSERYFSKNKVVEFSKILTWDKKRFDSLIERGWISTFRAKHPKSKPLYELSLKGQRMVASIYNILNGEEIPTASMYNPLFKSTASHGDKLFANAIKEMNESIKQQRLRSRESQYTAHR
jgi:DNA-binding MarR family transcriptional regulator